MKKSLAILSLCFFPLLPLHAQTHKPLALHPDNPHYFLFRGRPTILITSAEHYGAVLNRDFDYVKYLDELAKHDLNNTRTFTGVYCESPGAFRIKGNTLAPAKGRLLAPWARTKVGGYANGGNKFDLKKWNPAYFKRLKDFVAQASKRGIVVEMNLFCPFYGEEMWRLSPMKASNNVNGLGNIKRTEVYTLKKNGGLLVVQEALVRKIVTELNGFDNVYFEICNEPYFGGVTMPWQRRMVDVIVATEKKLPNKHLISMNIANKWQKVQRPHPAVTIFNFHYASPPKAVAMNYHLNKVIGDNETGFRGTKETHYRMEGWQFLLAGGGLYNNLDYSFTVGHEDGTFKYPDTQPGNGSRKFRRQMKILRDFMYSFDFIHMKPNTSFIKSKPKNVAAYALMQQGKQYAAYLFGGSRAELTLHLPKGTYRAEWLNPTSGKIESRLVINHRGGNVRIESPKYGPDIALRIRRKS